MPRDPKPIQWKTLLVLLSIAVGVGALYRFTDLAKRPMHTDEAILALKTQEFWQSGTFEYDPKDYHGPVLHHIAKWVGQAAGWSAESLTEGELRWVVALCGMLLVLSPLLFMDLIGRTGAGISAILLAASPMMTFYSRYYIMEVPFVLLVAVFIAVMWRWAQKNNYFWLAAAGVVLGLLHATKETFVLNIAAMVAAWGAVTLMGLSFRPNERGLGFGGSSRKASTWVPVTLVVAVAAIASIAMFSNGFQDWGHVKDSVLTYESYLGRSGGRGHEKPWHYYLTLLFWRQQGFLWSEALIGGLAVVGILNAFLDDRRAGHKRAFLTWLAIYTLMLLAIYCAIPYKTPWSILAAAYALALLAGLGMRTLYVFVSDIPALKVVLSLLLAGGILNLCLQTSLATDYKYPNETRYAASELHNPYAYSHTAPNLVALSARIHSLAEAHPAGKGMPVQVIQSEQGWPLPWYLRDLTHVGYQSEIPSTLTGPVVVVDADMEEAVRAKLGGSYETSLWGLRPGVTLCLLVENPKVEPEVPAPITPAAVASVEPPPPMPPPPPVPVPPVTPTTVAPEPVPIPLMTAMPPAPPNLAPAPQVPPPVEFMVPKAQLVEDEPEMVGPPFPVPPPPVR